MLDDMKECIGCMICVEVCPKKCIKVNMDDYGFEYPFVNEAICCKCGRCNMICPVLNHNKYKQNPLKVLAGWYRKGRENE